MKSVWDLLRYKEKKLIAKFHQPIVKQLDKVKSGIPFVFWDQQSDTCFVQRGIFMRINAAPLITQCANTSVLIVKIADTDQMSPVSSTPAIGSVNEECNLTNVLEVDVMSLEMRVHA